MLRVSAPAKLNLDLRVAKPRADGFHPLSSWFVTASLTDTLELSESRASQLTLTCSDATLSVGEDNLVVRATRAALQAAGCSAGLVLHLTKRIPTGAGLGGGSSDAAATLLAVRSLCRLHLSDRQLQELAADLGSDVPFFLAATSALCTGRGQHVHPLPPPAARHAVLVRPDLHISTPGVYRAFDQLHLGSDLPNPQTALAHYRSVIHLPAAELMTQLHNDLEPAAFHLEPRLGRLRQQLSDLLARPVRMTGSGCVMFTLFDSPDDALDAARRVTTTTDLPAAPIQAWAVQLCPDLPKPLPSNTPSDASVGGLGPTCRGPKIV